MPGGHRHTLDKNQLPKRNCRLVMARNAPPPSSPSTPENGYLIQFMVWGCRVPLELRRGRWRRRQRGWKRWEIPREDHKANKQGNNRKQIKRTNGEERLESFPNMEGSFPLGRNQETQNLEGTRKRGRKWLFFGSGNLGGFSGRSDIERRKIDRQTFHIPSSWIIVCVNKAITVLETSWNGAIQFNKVMSYLQ